MKWNFQQVLGAFIIGLIVPMVVMQIGARVIPPVQDSQSTTTQPTQQTNPQVNQKQPEKINVLKASGEIEEMELEEYLVGVILAEMPTSYSSAALQAQAVVARTFTLKRQQEQRHKLGAVCTDYACCQAYVSEEDYLDGLGYEEDVKKAAEAVKATEAEVVLYEDDLILATYFSCSGGRTEEAVAVWGVDYPYLQAVESPGEENMTDYMKQMFFSEEELEQALNRELTGSPQSWLGWTTYTTGGGVNTMYFAGFQYSGVELRSLLKLNSTVFTMKAQDGGVLITTLGKGHRVGMSQCGAEVMALEGCTYQEILKHYYPGIRIDKIENIR